LEPLVYHAAFARALASFLTGRAEEPVAHAPRLSGNRNLAFAYCILTLGCSRLGRSAEAAQAASRLIGVSRAFASASRKIWFPMLHVFNRTPNCCARQTHLSEAINSIPIVKNR
jgi:hypothetical protein